MKGVTDISYLSLLLGYTFLIIPIYLIWHYKIGLLKETVIAILRMTVQLLLVGFYLEYMFAVDNVLLNIAWFILMTFIATYTIIKRSSLSIKMFFIPIFISGIFSLAVTDAFFLGLIIKLENIFDTRYFIPITGMLLGNTIRTIITALNSYYGGIVKDKNLYRWNLANGATDFEAKQPFMKHALNLAFNPLIATTAIVGLISLPGMMTGQILGGSNPNLAIKYQIMIMITIFASGVISVILTMFVSDRFVFDKFGNLKSRTFKSNPS
jgi:putative ABC transport system permease protein